MPEGVWEAVAMIGSNPRDYRRDTGEKLYRRSMYTFWKRTSPPPSLNTFDAPDREKCTARRARTNTPLQALVLLNDPIFLEASRVFAANIVKSAPAFDSQLDWAFHKALNRAPSAEERAILSDLHRKSLASFESGDSNAKEFLSAGETPLPSEIPPAKLAAMTTIARAILNLHETITRN